MMMSRPSWCEERYKAGPYLLVQSRSTAWRDVPSLSHAVPALCASPPRPCLMSYYVVVALALRVLRVLHCRWPLARDIFHLRTPSRASTLPCHNTRTLP